ncbi:MAG: hypothetical protein RBQ91_08035 [Acholeplasma sp.]|jgi:hypothetical protein|nr:hypothetical protein [Acholeplasma sp.]
MIEAAVLLLAILVIGLDILQNVTIKRLEARIANLEKANETICNKHENIRKKFNPRNNVTY